VVESRMILKLLIKNVLKELVFPTVEDKSVDFSATMMLWRTCFPVRLKEVV